MSLFNNTALKQYQFGVDESTFCLDKSSEPSVGGKKSRKNIEPLKKLERLISNSVEDLQEKYKQIHFHQNHSRKSVLAFTQEKGSTSNFERILLEEQKIQKWDIDTLFSSNVLLKKFREYLVQRHDVDSLDFCIEVNDFNKIESEEERVKVGYAIYSRFLAESAPNMVNLDGEEKLKIVRKMVSSNIFSKKMFDPLVGMLRRLIEQNCLETKTFVNSVQFQEWSKQLFET